MITDADRERAKNALVRMALSEVDDPFDVLAASYAAAREAGEAKGRAEERETCVSIVLARLLPDQRRKDVVAAIRARGEAKPTCTGAHDFDDECPVCNPKFDRGEAAST